MPGDRHGRGQLTVVGADSTSIAKIDPEGATLAAATYTYGRAIAADSDGNIYSADRNRIVKIEPDGELTEFVTGVSVGSGMAVDSDDNLYAVSDRAVLRIDNTGAVATFSEPGGIVKAVAVGYDDAVYAVTWEGTLYRLGDDGAVTPVVTGQLQGASGLTTDAYGYFYVLLSQNRIVRVSPDGTKLTAYFDKAVFEYEGVNVVADCSNNLLFAPMKLDPLKPNRTEEDMIVQLNGDTGEVSQVLYGPSIDKTLTDIDVLYYDRFGQRLLMWGDVFGGKIFSFPVLCGGIDAEAHLVTRADVDLNSTDPAPDRTVDRPDGSREYVWVLNDVGASGKSVDLNLFFRGLAEGESRPILEEAFLSYGNSFAPRESVTVPIEIPELLAQSNVSVTAALDSSSVGAETALGIALDVTNSGSVLFEGTLQLEVVDESGASAARLPDIALGGIEAGATNTYEAGWNTGTTAAGRYTLVARVTSAVGLEVADASLSLEIVAGDGSGGGTVDAAASLDSAEYPSWSTPAFTVLLTNQALNAVAGPGRLEVVVRGPAGTTVHSDAYAVPEIVPGGSTSFSGQLALVDAMPGEYLLDARLFEDGSGAKTAADTAVFTVHRIPAQALIGSVEVAASTLMAGETTLCTDTVANRGSTAVTGAIVTHRVVSFDSGEIIDETSRTVDISAGESDVAVHTVASGGLASGSYGCLLNAEVAETTRSLGSAGFQVEKPPVDVDVTLESGARRRLLVLIDGDGSPGHGGRGMSRGHDPEQLQRCSVATDIDLEYAYGRQLAAKATLEVGLFDTAGALVDAESAEPGGEDWPVERNDGVDGVNLSLKRLSRDELELLVTGADAACAGDYVARVTTWEKGGSLAPVAAETAEGNSLVRSIVLSGRDRVDGEAHGSEVVSSGEREREHLERMLAEAGWSYTLVTDAESFAREFHSGGYVLYLLMSDREKLSERTQKELREAVFRGEGLVVVAGHDERNGRLGDALGLRVSGKYSHASGIVYGSSPLGLSGSVRLTSGEKPARVLLEGAAPIASYTGTRGSDESDDKSRGGGGDSAEHGEYGSNAAAAYYKYGRGSTVFAGFDLLAQAVAKGDGVFDELLSAALEYVHPRDLHTDIRSVVPLRLALTNLGVAVDTQTTLHARPGAEWVAAPGAVLGDTGTVQWLIPLAQDATEEVEAWLRLPELAGLLSVTADVKIAAGDEGFGEHKSLALALAATAESIPAVRAEVEGAVATDKQYREVARWLTDAEDYLAEGRAEKARDRLLQCADRLIRIDTELARELRYRVAALLRMSATQLDADPRGDGHTAD